MMLKFSLLSLEAKFDKFCLKQDCDCTRRDLVCEHQGGGGGTAGGRQGESQHQGTQH